MCKLIKLHIRGCVGGQIRLAGCVSIGEYVAQLALLVKTDEKSTHKY